jgi:hypothetical protein
MRVERDWLRRLVFDINDGRRFTQDSPILPDVWLKGGVEYCRTSDARIDLLLTPHRLQTAGVLARELLARLTAGATHDQESPRQERSPWVLTRPVWTLSVNQTNVAVSLTLKELITCALPLTEWWMRNVDGMARADTRVAPMSTGRDSTTKADKKRRDQERGWMARMVGVLDACGRAERRTSDITEFAQRVEDAVVRSS